MSTPTLLKAFVSERLTAAAEEIFQFFERTIAKYEEEATSSQQEIERLRGLLHSRRQTGSCQNFICKEETLPEQHQFENEDNLSVNEKDFELPHIKEEKQELWSSQKEEDQAQEFNNANIYLPHSSASQQNDELATYAQTQNSEGEEHFLDTKNVQFVLPHTSAPSVQALVHHESVHDSNESQRPAACLNTLHQTQTDRSQTSFVTSVELPHLNAGTSDHQCYLCDKSFSSHQHLIKHAFRIHSKEGGIICAVCGKAFESTESLHLHQKSYQSTKVCLICGKECNSVRALTEHMSSHTGEKPHRCHVCGKECGRKGDLKIHMRIHTGEKPFCCSVCCKSFTHSSHLIKHMRSHTGERPYQCHVCGRGFLQSTHLRYHLGTHTQKH